MRPHGYGSGGPGGMGRPRGPKGRSRMEEPPAVSAADVTGWLVGRLPDGWFEGEPAVSIDRDEILIVGRIPAPTPVADADPASVAEGRASRFREDTRNARIEVAQEAEAKYARKVSWGVEVGDYRYLFTTLAAPAMTRLRQPERQVLDTLVEAGVARSRAEALAWCVQLVGQNEQEWITSLRTALDDVERVRRQGPA